MNPQPNRASLVIVAAIDTSDESDEAFHTAVQLGQALPRAELHFLYVVQPPPPDGGSGILPTIAETTKAAGELLRASALRARDAVTGTISCHVAVGRAAEEILSLGADVRADLIIVGSRRKTRAERWLLGSVSEQVVRKAPCAVLVAKPNAHAAVPEVEPPCSDCVSLQTNSASDRLWCDRHDRTKRHPQGRLHYEIPRAFGAGSMLLRPEG